MGAFKLRRLTTFDNYLHRELFALNGVTVYDHNIYKTDAKDVQPDELVFLYDGKYYKVNNNLFKKREKNIRATLAEIPITDADREAITQQ
ncbi:proline-rich protein 15-like protein-like protein, partial [Corchorus olitorius]